MSTGMILCQWQYTVHVTCDLPHSTACRSFIRGVHKLKNGTHTHGRPVLPGRPVPTDGLALSLDPGAGPSSHQDRHLQPAPASGSVLLQPLPAPLPRPPVFRPWARPTHPPSTPPPPHSQSMLPRPGTCELIPPAPSPFPCSEANRAPWAGHRPLLIMGPPGGGGGAACPG